MWCLLSLAPIIQSPLYYSTWIECNSSHAITLGSNPVQLNGLETGKHSLKIIPQDCGHKYHQRSVKFTVWVVDYQMNWSPQCLFGTIQCVWYYNIVFVFCYLNLWSVKWPHFYTVTWIMDTFHYGTFGSNFDFLYISAQNNNRLELYIYV